MERFNPLSEFFFLKIPVDRLYGGVVRKSERAASAEERNSRFGALDGNLADEFDGQRRFPGQHEIGERCVNYVSLLAEVCSRERIA